LPMSEDVRKRMAALGSDAAGEGPEAFARLIASESEKWKSLIKAKGIKAD